MDKSEQYIKMCEAAKEIQKAWQPDVGDYFLSDYRGRTGFSKDVEEQIWGNDKDTWEKIQCLTYKPSIREYVVISDSDGSHTYTMSDFFKYKHIFLPSQDYLQKLLENDEPYRLFNKLYVFGEKSYPFSSCEQLTLGYVMKKLYNKEWNGSEWIKGD